ncbi:MAG: YbjQ family protein [Candidatus Omnitrophica bacterium]|nr:YbjQ family protein [Candidatus Omnitrophota bacterium]
MELIIQSVWALITVTVSYFTGSLIEMTHYREIEQREKELSGLPAVSSKNIEDASLVESAGLVSANVVISLDYFKRFLASLRNIVGGRIKSYETLLDRGRREAVLRMKQQARAQGADMVLNMRFETSGIGNVTQNRKKSIGCFEVLAYGTAVKLRKQ